MLDVILIALTIFLTTWYILYTKRRFDVPPGPASLPVVGLIPFLDKDPRDQLVRWRRRFGDVFSFYMGSRLMVVLNGYGVLKEALVKKADVFSVRPKMFVTEMVTQRGIVFNSGPGWKEQRKVSIQILRSLGMGKQKFADNALEEVSEFIKAVGQHQGQVVDLSDLVTVSVSNNICFVLFGRRFEYDCPSFLRYLSLVQENLRSLRSTNLINFLPWLRFLPGDLSNAKKVLRNVVEMEKCFLGPQIQRHMNNDNDVDNEKDDFISAYIREIKNLKGRGDSSSTINEESLLWTVFDLFVAGTETLTSSILWIFIFLLHNPRVQERCFQEINDVIGMTSPPSVRNRSEMPYVEATIMETLRMADVGALGVQHGVTRQVKFRDFVIPRDATILPFLHSALHDPAAWEDPGVFRPERFLDSSSADGLKKKDEFIPFSLGRRKCPGEGIARQQLFFYVTSLIQHFRFLPPEDGTLPSLNGVMGLTYTPQPFRLRAVPRDVPT